ncbi:MAG: hypothetical protein H7831_09740 [Magnetococcus sp. WYHC-3]
MNQDEQRDRAPAVAGDAAVASAGGGDAAREALQRRQRAARLKGLAAFREAALEISRVARERRLASAPVPGSAAEHRREALDPESPATVPPGAMVSAPAPDESRPQLVEPSPVIVSSPAVIPDEAHPVVTASHPLPSAEAADDSRNGRPHRVDVHNDMDMPSLRHKVTAAAALPSEPVAALTPVPELPPVAAPPHVTPPVATPSAPPLRLGSGGETQSPTTAMPPKELALPAGAAAGGDATVRAAASVSRPPLPLKWPASAMPHPVLTPVVESPEELVVRLLVERKSGIAAAPPPVAQRRKGADNEAHLHDPRLLRERPAASSEVTSDQDMLASLPPERLEVRPRSGRRTPSPSVLGVPWAQEDGTDAAGAAAVPLGFAPLPRSFSTCRLPVQGSAGDKGGAPTGASRFVAEGQDPGAPKPRAGSRTLAGPFQEGGPAAPVRVSVALSQPVVRAEVAPGEETVRRAALEMEELRRRVAQVEPPWSWGAVPRAPGVEAAEVKAAEVKAPEVKAPEVKAAEVKAPEVKAAEVKAPEVKAAEVKAPEVKAAEVKAAEVKAPSEVEIPLVSPVPQKAVSRIPQRMTASSATDPAAAVATGPWSRQKQTGAAASSPTARSEVSAADLPPAVTAEVAATPPAAFSAPVVPGGGWKDLLARKGGEVPPEEPPLAPRSQPGEESAPTASPRVVWRERSHVAADLQPNLQLMPPCSADEVDATLPLGVLLAEAALDGERQHAASSQAVAGQAEVAPGADAQGAPNVAADVTSMLDQGWEHRHRHRRHGIHGRNRSRFAGRLRELGRFVGHGHVRREGWVASVWGVPLPERRRMAWVMSRQRVSFMPRESRGSCHEVPFVRPRERVVVAQVPGAALLSSLASRFLSPLGMAAPLHAGDEGTQVLFRLSSSEPTAPVPPPRYALHDEAEPPREVRRPRRMDIALSGLAQGGTHPEPRQPLTYALRTHLEGSPFGRPVSARALRAALSAVVRPRDSESDAGYGVAPQAVPPPLLVSHPVSQETFEPAALPGEGVTSLPATVAHGEVSAPVPAPALVSGLTLPRVAKVEAFSMESSPEISPCVPPTTVASPVTAVMEVCAMAPGEEVALSPVADAAAAVPPCIDVVAACEPAPALLAAAAASGWDTPAPVVMAPASAPGILPPVAAPEVSAPAPEAAAMPKAAMSAAAPPPAPPAIAVPPPSRVVAPSVESYAVVPVETLSQGVANLLGDAVGVVFKGVSRVGGLWRSTGGTPSV